MLKCLRFKGAAINDRLALAVFVDTLAEGFSRLFRMSKLDGTVFARLRQEALGFDFILQRA